MTQWAAEALPRYHAPLSCTTSQDAAGAAILIPSKASGTVGALTHREAETVTTQLQEGARLLAGARRVVVFTGAGVSAESGVPTYRSASDGLWSVQNMERYANPRGYRANLREAYAWYRA